MISDALYVTLRVPDPSALTALAALRLMGPKAPVRLERGRVWWVSGDPGAFESSQGVWFNPNKERGLRWNAAGGFGERRERERWVFVRDRSGSPEAGALRSMRERGLPEPLGLLSATVWRLQAPEGVSPDEAAQAASVVRSAFQGLLVNRHSQAHRVGPAPASLTELEQVLSELKREAS